MGVNDQEQPKHIDVTDLAKAPLNWPTLILILVTGGGNWFATLSNRGQIDYGREQVIRQVNDLHSALDDFEKRQRQILDNQSRILEQIHKNNP